MKNNIFLLLILLFLSCSSDYSKNLGDGFLFRSEGTDLNDILHKKGEIPANILCYSYNCDYILAIQKPGTFQDPLYEKTYIYPNGDSILYYWIVVKETCLIWGPLNQKEFNNIVLAYNVPKRLVKKIENYNKNYIK